MRRLRRITLVAALVAAGPLLAGCENFDLDQLDVFHLNDKKKLPGERKELFPAGVPGVTQGVPPEYLKENQPPPETAADLAAPAPAKDDSAGGDKAQTEAGDKAQTATASTELQEAPKPKPKRKPKPQTAQRAPTQITIQRGSPTQQPADAASAQPAWPAPAQQQPAQSPWPAANQPAANSPWPAPPPPGTFSR